MQKKEETVEQYATAFSALIKRVDPDGDLPEDTKIHMFLRGLLPAIQYQLQNYLVCTQNLTFRGVVTAAQQYEHGQAAHLQALAETAPAAATLTVTIPMTPTADPLQELMKQMTQLLTPMATAIAQMQQQMAQGPPRQYAPQRSQYQAAPTHSAGNPQWQQRQPRG